MSGEKLIPSMIVRFDYGKLLAWPAQFDHHLYFGTFIGCLVSVERDFPLKIPRCRGRGLRVAKFVLCGWQPRSCQMSRWADYPP